MADTIQDPPEMDVTETNLKYHVMKVEGDDRTLVNSFNEAGQANEWMVRMFFDEMGPERTWHYELVERRRITTHEVLLEL